MNQKGTTKKVARAYKGRSLNYMLDDYVLVDIETTGLSPQRDDIIEIGAIKVKGNRIVERFHSLLSINRMVPPFITELTGITTEALRQEGRPPQMVLQEFLEFTGDSVLVGHNVNFDINFLYDKCEKYLHETLPNDFIDTMKLAKRVVRTPNYKLGTLADYFQVGYDGAHRSMNDVEITFAVYNHIKTMLEAKEEWIWNAEFRLP